MPALKNAKHELFAQELAKGVSQKDAYEIAGYKPNEPHASRLASNGNVRARLTELQRAAGVRAEITIESLIDEADAIQRAAFKENQFSASSGALKLKAVLSGLYVEKSDNTNTNRNVDPNDISDEEIAAVLRTGGDARPPSKANGSSKPH